MATKSKNSADVETIKTGCSLLHACGFNYLVASFDGSGDSGDLDFIVLCHKKPTDDYDTDCGYGYGNYTHNDDRAKTLSTFETDYLSNCTNPDQCRHAESTLKALKTSLWRILPEGFEQNDGSYGLIKIELATGKIKMIVNERISDINTSVQEF